MPEEITLENLAEKMDEGFKKAEKHTDEKIDGLALAVAKGFKEVDERFDKVDEKFRNVDARLDIIETDVKGIKQEIIPLERHNDLKSRVDLLEEKAGIVS